MPFPPRPVDATRHGVVDDNAGTMLLTVPPKLLGVEGRARRASCGSPAPSTSATAR